jgi:hypothetical protein
MMVITPSGAFNSSDWNGNSTSMINVSGGLSSTQKDTAHSNNFMGAKCISLKGNKLRDVRRGIQLTRVTNSVLYDNRIKFFSEDAVDEYSDNRILSAHNLIEDSVQSWAHQDAIQKAISGSGSGYMYFGNAEIENEMYEATDATNYMPKGMEGIITTDEEWWGNYSADNISIATTNGIHTTGAYDVSVHNTVLGQAVTLDWNKKEAKPTFQINGLMANNVANGINRAPYIFNCSGTATDPLITLKTNVAIPFVPGTGATSVIACNGTTIINGGNPGAFDGLDNWNATDWRSGGATASSLFVSYHPVDPAPPGGYLQNTWTGGQGVNNTCAHGTFPGSCPAGNGTVDLRPNPSFAGFTGRYSLRVQYPQNLPDGRADGTLAMVASTVRAAQAGIWSACASCSLYTNGTTIHWQFVSPSYNPGIIGAGTNLGPQQPLTDIEGKAWKASPTIGAFEEN